MKKYLNENVESIKKVLMKDLVLDLWDGEDEDDVSDVKKEINKIVEFKEDGVNGFIGVNKKGWGVELGFSIIKSKKDIGDDEEVSCKIRDINGKKVCFIYYNL